MADPLLLEVKGVRQAFPKAGGRELVVLDGLDMTLKEGEIVGTGGALGLRQIDLPAAGRWACAADFAVMSAIWANRLPGRPKASPWCFRASRCFRG